MGIVKSLSESRGYKRKELESKIFRIAEQSFRMPLPNLTVNICVTKSTDKAKEPRKENENILVQR